VYGNLGVYDTATYICVTQPVEHARNDIRHLEFLPLTRFLGSNPGMTISFYSIHSHSRQGNHDQTPLQAYTIYIDATLECSFLCSKDLNLFFFFR
jgi:hypothetical protein